MTMTYRCACGLEIHLCASPDAETDLRALALLGWARGAGGWRCDRCAAGLPDRVPAPTGTAHRPS